MGKAAPSARSRKPKPAAAIDYGLAKTKNDMAEHSWPVLTPINQKNYYTEYLKRDEQILAIRLQNEANREKMVRAARDKDRALAQSAAHEGTPADGYSYVAENGQPQDGEDSLNEQESIEAKTIIIHPGSQTLRIGLASDVLPRNVPMVIARKSSESESEMFGGEPSPKRRKIDEDSSPERGKIFDNEFAEEVTTRAADVKARLRTKGVRSVPNAREQAIIFNKRTAYNEISVHNDPGQIEWTEIPNDSRVAPDIVVGKAALRIPDLSKPRYQLFRPLRYGSFNEKDYSNENQVMRDLEIIIEDAIKNELGLKRKRELAQYGCVYVVPDLYERGYVTRVLELLCRDFGFGRVCFIQESLSASYGAGYSNCVVVDVGAQKTSICCVDDGICLENSRINLRYGGDDVTETFMRIMLLDSFPYADINLKRRYDLLVADELKRNCCTLNLGALEKGTQQHEFTLRAPDQNTRTYQFKTFDEVIMAPMGYFFPVLFDHTDKLVGRRKLISRSYDIYDGAPNDPVSSAQSAVLKAAAENDEPEPMVVDTAPTQAPQPLRKLPDNVENGVNSAIPSPAATPGPQEEEAGHAVRASSPAGGEKEAASNREQERELAIAEMLRLTEKEDRTLPVLPLIQAINLSIEAGAREYAQNNTPKDIGKDSGKDLNKDAMKAKAREAAIEVMKERKQRDYYGGVLCTGGGALTPNFYQFLEEELMVSQSRNKKVDIIVGPPPREIDPQVLAWKGASVFGKLQSNDTWISQQEYSLLNSRVLTYKTLWQW